jgi:hypothetical protein
MREKLLDLLQRESNKNFLGLLLILLLGLLLFNL